jgi:hypothetical protein
MSSCLSLAVMIVFVIISRVLRVSPLTWMSSRVRLLILWLTLIFHSDPPCGDLAMDEAVFRSGSLGYLLSARGLLYILVLHTGGLLIIATRSQ